MAEVSIIIVSFNTAQMTLECIESVYSETNGVSFELIIVDNNSSDGSAEKIRDKFPALNLITSTENLGFARANNLAARQASGKYLLLLNPDTIVLNGAITKLLEFAKNNTENKVYGGKTLFADRSLNHTSCWGKPTLWSTFCYGIGLTSVFRRNSLFDPESYGGWQRDSVREVDIVTGCFLMIEKKLWEELQGFDLDFFMYGEDADLCLRASKLGANPVITPDAVIVHYGGASEPVRSDMIVRLFRAKIQLMEKHWSLPSYNIGKLLLGISSLLRTVATKMLTFVDKDKYIGNYNSWNSIWSRRSEWMEL